MAWQLYYQTEIWADCLRMYGVDVTELPGGDGLVLANMILIHFEVDHKTDPPRPLSAVLQAMEADRVPDDVYDPDRDNNEADLLDEHDALTNPEFEGLIEFDEVEL